MRQSDFSPEDFIRYKSVSKGMRRLMSRLGFEAPCVKLSDVDNQLVVVGYDPFNSKHFCRSYTLDDLEAILHASNVFWRYIK